MGDKSPKSLKKKDKQKKVKSKFEADEKRHNVDSKSTKGEPASEET